MEQLTLAINKDGEAPILTKNEAATIINEAYRYALQARWRIVPVKPPLDPERVATGGAGPREPDNSQMRELSDGLTAHLWELAHWAHVYGTAPAPPRRDMWLRRDTDTRPRGDWRDTYTRTRVQCLGTRSGGMGAPAIMRHIVDNQTAILECPSLIVPLAALEKAVRIASKAFGDDEVTVTLDFVSRAVAGRIAGKSGRTIQRWAAGGHVRTIMHGDTTAYCKQDIQTHMAELAREHRERPNRINAA